MIVSRYIQKVFLYRLFAVFGISFGLAMFIELTSIVTEPNVMEDILPFIFYTFCKGLVFTDSAMFFVVIIATVIFANYVSNTRQLEIILLYNGNPTFFIKKIALVIFAISLFYIFAFHGFFYYKIVNFMNTYRATHIMKDSVAKLWLTNIDISNPQNIKGDIFLLKNVKMHQNGFIIEKIRNYKIENGTLAKYIEYSKTFITNTPTNEMVFFSLDKNSHIIRNAMPKVKFEDIYSHFIESGGKVANQNIYSEMQKVINASNYNRQSIDKAYVYLLNILQTTFLMFAGCILVLAYLLNISGRNISYSFTTIKVISYSIIIYAMTEIVKMIYPHTTINYIVSFMLTITTILIFTSKFIKKYC